MTAADQGTTAGLARPMDEGELRALCESAARFERRRWLGVFLMYSPTLFLMCMFAVVALHIGPRTAPNAPQPLMARIQMALMAPVAFGLLLSLAAAVAGVFIRGASAVALTRLGLESAVDRLEGHPGLERGERLGQWVVTAAEPGRLQLAHRLCPPFAFGIMRWGSGSIIMMFLTLGVLSALQGAYAGIVGGAGAAAVFFLLLRPFLIDRRIEFGSDAPVTVRESLHALLPARRKTFDLQSIACVPRGVALEAHEGPGLVIGELASFPALGVWQARRLGAAIEETVVGSHVSGSD